MFVLVYVHFVSSYLYARRIGLSHKTREYTLYGYYDDKNNELVKISLGGGDQILVRIYSPGQKLLKIWLNN